MRYCNIREVSNMMCAADNGSKFFSNSPERQLALEKWIMYVYSGAEKRTKLEKMCKTRWVERHDAFEVMIEQFLLY